MLVDHKPVEVPMQELRDKEMPEDLVALEPVVVVVVLVEPVVLAVVLVEPVVLAFNFLQHLEIQHQQ
jgi:hypothetical protein